MIICTTFCWKLDEKKLKQYFTGKDETKIYGLQVTYLLAVYSNETQVCLFIGSDYISLTFLHLIIILQHTQGNIRYRMEVIIIRCWIHTYLSHTDLIANAEKKDPKPTSLMQNANASVFENDIFYLMI